MWPRRHRQRCTGWLRLSLQLDAGRRLKVSLGPRLCSLLWLGKWHLIRRVRPPVE